MNPELRKEIEDLYLQYKVEDLAKPDRLARWRNLEPESALFISIIVRAQQAANILEIGTSNGYSTLWLADALKDSNGWLTTIEIEETRTFLAKENLERFNLISKVDFITDDAGAFLKKSEPIYDTIFLDAERQYYAGYWDDLKKLVMGKSGATLIVDNVVSHKEQVKDFLEIIENDREVISTIVHVGAGILIVTKN